MTFIVFTRSLGTMVHPSHESTRSLLSHQSSAQHQKACITSSTKTTGTLTRFCAVKHQSDTSYPHTQNPAHESPSSTIHHPPPTKRHPSSILVSHPRTVAHQRSDSPSWSLTPSHFRSFTNLARYATISAVSAPVGRISAAGSANPYCKGGGCQLGVRVG
jgi:hypothetical protein